MGVPAISTGESSNCGLIEIIHKDGQTYVSPHQSKGPHINSIRKWEQAFKVYAAIYCEANPECAAEIWQYAYAINTAANSLQWENVAFYDNTFRQLME